MIRIRTIIAAVAGVLAIAVPASTAGAAVPTVAQTPTTPRMLDVRAAVTSAPTQADINASLEPFRLGAQAAIDGWTAGANAALSGWTMGLQGAAAGFQAGADALTGLSNQLQSAPHG
jgi:hypothetical protein